MRTSESNSFNSPEPGNDSSAVHPIPGSPPLDPKHIPKWEWQLPRHYVLAATPSERSLNLDIAIQTTDTGEVHAVSALLDSGATGLFIDPEFVQQNCLTMWLLARAIPVYNVDGTPNEQGAIHDIVDVSCDSVITPSEPSLQSQGWGRAKWYLGSVGFGSTTLRSTGPQVMWRWVTVPLLGKHWN